MNIKICTKDSKTLFAFLSGINRDINPSQVTKLATSLNKMGCIRPVIVANIDFIDGKRKRYIIDGQHLFYALLRNNSDIPYMEINVTDLKDLVEKIALLNSSSKSWALLDYIKSWSCILEDYKKLNRYFNTYDLDLRTLSNILSENVSTSGNITTKIKKGNFKIINEKQAIVIIENLTDVLTILPRMNRTENSYLCTEYVEFIKSVSNNNHKDFLIKLELQKEKFTLVTQEHGKLNEMFKKIIK